LNDSVSYAAGTSTNSSEPERAGRDVGRHSDTERAPSGHGSGSSPTIGTDYESGGSNKDERESTTEELYLVSFSRYPVELRDALQTGPLLAPVRAALRTREPQWKGAKLFCSVDQHEAVVDLAETTNEDVRPYHVLLTQSYRDALMKTIKRCPSRKGVRVKQEILLGFVPVPKRRPAQAYAQWKEEKKALEPEQTPYPSILELLQNPSNPAYPSPYGSGKSNESYSPPLPYGGSGKSNESYSPSSETWGKGPAKKGEKGKKGDRKGKKGFEPQEGKGKKGAWLGYQTPDSDDERAFERPATPPRGAVPAASEIAACVSNLLDSAHQNPFQEALADRVVDELEAIVRDHRTKQNAHQLVMNFLSMPSMALPETFLPSSKSPEPETFLPDLPFGVPMPPHFGPVATHLEPHPTHFGSGEPRAQRLARFPSHA
jgi:hypothetical protein